MSIPHCDTHTAIEAFRKGLSPTEELYRELTKYPCRTFEDVQAKAMAQVRMEEDEKSVKAVPESTPRVERRIVDSRKERRVTPYGRPRPDSTNVNVTEGKRPH